MDFAKKFVLSGVKDVIDNQMNKNKNQPPPPAPDQGYSQQGGAGYNPYQGGGGSGYSQGGGYPPQQGGYDQGGYNQGGYGGGYPQQPGYPGQGGGPGYPPQPGHGGAPYPTGDQGGYGAPPPIGFGQPGGYPPSGQGYQPQTGYPSQQQGGFPQQGGYPQQGYPPQQGGQGGYGGQPNYGGGYPGGGYGGGGAPSHGGHGQGPSMIGTPSIRAVQGFNANADAEVLRKAMKGLGCNNAKVISVLCARTNWQRQEISRAFKVMYGKDLIKDLKSELSGDFEDLILALLEPPAVYDAKQLHKAMEGLGTKESVLIEIMTSRTNQQIAEIKQAYRQLYGKELEKDLIGETSGCFKRLLISMCAGGRDEGNYVDPLRANQDARRLYSAGERRLGTDESCFNAILASQNFAQLRVVFDEYQKVTNHSIEKAIESEFSGDIKDGLLAVIAVVRNRPAYFAQLLHASMKGLGTRDNDLIRLVVSRAEYDMVDIRNAFQQLYRTTLENMIKGDCSGSYKDGLIALVKGN